MLIACLLPESLGDFLLTTPSLKALEVHFSREEICWLFPDSLQEISTLVPLKAKRIPLSFVLDHHKTSMMTKPDITFCFPPATKYYWWAKKIGGEKRGGYVHEKMWIPRLFSKISLTHYWICPANLAIHELEAYGKILELFSIPFKPEKPLLEIPQAFLEKAQSWIENKPKNKKKIVGIHLGARWPTNPLHFFKGLPYPLLVLFSKAEEEMARKWVEEFGGDLLVPGVQNLAFYAAFLKTCTLLVAVDGGPVHMASAVGTPVVAFYPEEDFEKRVAQWHPWGVPYKAERLNQSGLSKVPQLLESLL
jgi:ADP-heptose:LPS heptosyltransferase